MTSAHSDPDMPSSEHNMALRRISPSHQGLTPPNSPTKGTIVSPAIVKDLKHLFGVFLEKALLDLTNKEPPNTSVSQDESPPGPVMVQLKQLLVKLMHNEYASAELPAATDTAQSCLESNKQEDIQVADGIALSSPICTAPDDFKSFAKWASTPQFKTDKEACKYKVAEPVETRSGQEDYAEYAFIIRERIKRNSHKVTPYIDIKSEGLRDILRVVLHDIKAISLIEDKPSIEQNVLFHFLSELDRYAENIDNSSDHESALAELRILIDHLKQAYIAISQRLSSILQHGHITYDLLWALFKPGCYIYTIYISTKEP
ncbi:uncharacterized protein N7458_009122 [Penicillium daleae]|uniref:DUF7025 domain-containing protein n=1 Tax=Penicillium daleae TaxID=63821 RepID=A0AAD6BWB6_9EURO|nr:uncharacterized protein N7458_009122 [Penicillium daleae]KAJ5438124.1 hypothetical protein N7458_009122 [Penicillium daleae]